MAAVGGGSALLVSRNEALAVCAEEVASKPCHAHFERFTALCLERFAQTVSDAEMVELGALIGRVEGMARSWSSRRAKVPAIIRRIENACDGILRLKHLDGDELRRAVGELVRRHDGQVKLLNMSGISERERAALFEVSSDIDRRRSVLQGIQVDTERAVSPLFFLSDLTKKMLEIKEALGVEVALPSDPELERIVRSLLDRGITSLSLSSLGQGASWNAYRIDGTSYVLKSLRGGMSDFEHQREGVSTGMLLGSDPARGYSGTRLALMLEPGKPILIEKYIPGETLEAFSKKKLEGVDHAMFAREFATFCCNYIELCQKGFLNMDVADANVMVSPAEEGGVRFTLIDFGEATYRRGEHVDISTMVEAYAHMGALFTSIINQLDETEYSDDEEDEGVIPPYHPDDIPMIINEQFGEGASENFAPALRVYARLYQARMDRVEIDVAALREEI